MNKKRWMLLVVVALLVGAGVVAAFWLNAEKQKSPETTDPPNRIAPLSEVEQAAVEGELKTWDKNHTVESNASAEEKYYYHTQRASLLGGAGKHQEALDELSKAEASGFTVSYLLHMERGMYYQFMGNNAQAKDSFQKSINLAGEQLEGEAELHAVESLKTMLEQVP